MHDETRVGSSAPLSDRRPPKPAFRCVAGNASAQLRDGRDPILSAPLPEERRHGQVSVRPGCQEQEQEQRSHAAGRPHAGQAAEAGGASGTSKTKSRHGQQEVKVADPIHDLAMTTVATPAPAAIRILEDMRAGDLNSTELLAILHWRVLNTAAPHYLDQAAVRVQLQQLLAALSA